MEPVRPRTSIAGHRVFLHHASHCNRRDDKLCASTGEKDEDGFGYREDDDFSDTDWLSEFKDTYRTPKELIDLLKETAKELVGGKMPNKPKSFWKDVMADCENWSIDDEETDIL